MQQRSIEVIQSYIDLMASVFSVLATQSEAELSQIKAADGYDSIFQFVKARFDAIRSSAVSDLLETIRFLLDEMDRAEPVQRIICAEATCLCMDQQISYQDHQTIWENGRMYLFDILPLRDDKPLLLDHPLNSNWKDTGICIIPRFPVSTAATYIDSKLKDRPLSGRNTPYGINRELVNVGYYPWDTDVPDVRHIILSDRQLPSTHDQVSKTRVAFSPIADHAQLLDLENKPKTALNGRSCTGIFVSGVKETQMLNVRYSECWEMACELSPDVFFAPEMIATDEMVSVDNLRSKYLKPLLKKVVVDGKTPPRLTILPTHWRNRRNRLLVFDETGKHIGTQFKRKPFVDEKNHAAEALELPLANADVLLIHLKNKQRIAFAICSDFLIGQEDYVSDFLCKKLGATLVLVPSYSQGEQDFAAAISAVKRFGTSVVWGNCCGAVPKKDKKPTERIIGACCYAGTDAIHRLGRVQKCDFACEGTQGCVFSVELPTRVELNKPNTTPMPEISHLCGQISAEKTTATDVI